MRDQIGVAAVDRDELRIRISGKYRDVAMTPEVGFHFHTGAPLAKMLGYPDAAVAKLPVGTVDSFAGTGNPFLFGDMNLGDVVVDVGCGAGFDTLTAATQAMARPVTASSIDRELLLTLEAAFRKQSSNSFPSSVDLTSTTVRTHSAGNTLTSPVSIIGCPRSWSYWVRPAGKT